MPSIAQYANFAYSWPTRWRGSSMRCGPLYIAMIVAGALACGGSGGGEPTQPPGSNQPPASQITSIQVTPTPVTIDSGQAATLTASLSYTGTSAPNVTLSWSSSDVGVATVSSRILTALSWAL